MPRHLSYANVTAYMSPPPAMSARQHSACTSKAARLEGRGKMVLPRFGQRPQAAPKRGPRAPGLSPLARR
jgi:hypothetical protein